MFEGAVHATSETSVTFDCDRLLVEFDDVRRSSDFGARPAPRWFSWFSGVAPESRWQEVVAAPLRWIPWIGFDVAPAVLTADLFLEQIVADLLPRSIRREDRSLYARAAKEPAYLLATGNAVALITNVDPRSGALESRVRISGPKLSLNLRRDATKMLIEGPGNLLLEDYRENPSPSSHRAALSASKPSVAAAPGRNGLLASERGGPSTTLIEWRHSMWYDFSIDQTRFEGDVELKYFSGAALRRALNYAETEDTQGRSTFLSCDMLTIDFLDRPQRRSNGDGPRMGRLSAGSLRRFDARGRVRLQDDAERLSLQADQVIYERPRDILVIYGTPQRKAVIIRHEPNKLPTRIQVQRMIYDLATGKFTIDNPELTGQ